MQRTRLNFEGRTRSNRLKSVVAAIFSMACFATLCTAQQAGQKTFSSAGRCEQRSGRGGREQRRKGDDRNSWTRGKANHLVRRRNRGCKYPRQFRPKVSGNAPPSRGTGWNHYFVYRCEELAYAYTVGEQGRPVVLRYRGRVREKSCTGELAGMKYRPFAFARNWWRHKRNSMLRSTPVTPRKS